jgi:hypothetical protein
MKVAINKVKITPKNYDGMPMAGYTRPDPCLGKLDDIYAYGVLLEIEDVNNSEKSLLLISLDLLKLPLSIANYIKSKITGIYNFLKPEQILLHCTHTHSAPDLTGEFHFPGGMINAIKGIMFGMNRNDHYIIWFSHQIIILVKSLFNKLKPCKIGWIKRSFNPDIVINRRHPSRKPKPDLGIIAFRGLNNNELIGFIINYACHPTTLPGSNNKMSADYPGRIINKINDLTKNKINVAYFNGPSADLNPITTCGTDYDELEKTGKEGRKKIYDQSGTYENTINIGSIIAQEALKLAQSIKDEEFFELLNISTILRNFWIPFKDYKYFKPTWYQNTLSFNVKKFLIIPITKILSENANFPAFIIKRRPIRRYCYTVIQHIDLNVKSKTKEKKLSVLTVPGELFEDLGKILFKKSPAGKKDTFIFQNANDWIAYLFSPKEYIELGGYEPVASFSPRCGEYTIKEMLKLFRELRTQEFQ